MADFDWNTLGSKLMQTWPARMGQDALSAARLPGDVYAGNVTPDDQGYYDRVAQLAQLLVGTPGGQGGLGSGARLSFTERMQLGKDIAMERANRGQSTGNYGMAANRNAPESPKGSFDRLATETRSRWGDDKAAAMDAYRNAVGGNIQSSSVLAPGETLADLATGFF